MATILWVKRLINEGEASQGSSGETEKRTYLVYINEKNASPLEVCRATHADMPSYFSANDTNPNIVVNTKTAKRVTEDGKPSVNLWHVDADYGSPNFTDGKPKGETSTSQNIRVSIRSNKQTIQTQMSEQRGSTAPQPIRNSVGDLYPEGIEKVINDVTIEVDYETDSIDNAAWDAVVGCVNSSTVTLTLPQGDKTYTRTFAAYTLLLDTADRDVTLSKSDPTVTKWHNHIVLQYRGDGWDKKLPDKGYRWIDSIDDEGGSDEFIWYTDWKDHAEYLDGNGKKLADGSAIVALDPIPIFKEANLATVLSTI